MNEYSDAFQWFKRSNNKLWLLWRATAPLKQLCKETFGIIATLIRTVLGWCSLSKYYFPVRMWLSLNYHSTITNYHSDLQLSLRKWKRKKAWTAKGGKKQNELFTIFHIISCLYIAFYPLFFVWANLVHCYKITRAAKLILVKMF